MIFDYYIYRKGNDYKLYAIKSGCIPESIDLWYVYAGPFDTKVKANVYLSRNRLIIGESNDT